MILSNLTSAISIVTGSSPSNMFLTMYNNLIMMVNILKNSNSITSGITSSISGTTLTISSHTRLYPDGTSKAIPEGTITVSTTPLYVTYENNAYSTSETRIPQGQKLIVGYYNGTTFTPT